MASQRLTQTLNSNLILYPAGESPFATITNVCTRRSNLILYPAGESPSSPLSEDVPHSRVLLQYQLLVGIYAPFSPTISRAPHENPLEVLVLSARELKGIIGESYFGKSHGRHDERIKS